MKIAVDLRSLQSGEPSGVENYILNVLENLLKEDRRNQYIFFHNAFHQINLDHLRFVNSQIVQTRLPNRLLNLSLKYLGRPELEGLCGDFDWLFLPNFNQFVIRPATKLALTVHDLSAFLRPEFYNLKRRLWHKLLAVKKILTRADLIFAASEFTKADLISHFGVSESKIQTVYLGIDRTVFHPQISEESLRQVRNFYGLPGNFMLFLGTIEPRKNLISVVKAFEKLQGNLHLVIAGKKGWKYANTFRQIKNSPKRRFIRYLGYVSEAHKPQLIKLAKTLVCPSFYEGFGLPPLEAMSVGTPVITSQLSSLPEITGSAAILINPYNIGDLSHAMSEAVNNQALRQALTQKGLLHASRFDWRNTARQILIAMENYRPLAK